MTYETENAYAGMNRKEIWTDLQQTMPKCADFIMQLKRHGITIDTPRKFLRKGE